ncbi:hypothetical protein, partial [Escherichia coli]|uniref:hypothetical protein n=1 Tax=Escherichia coli TaxID=562 RepID=UPI0012FF7815
GSGEPAARCLRADQVLARISGAQYVLKSTVDDDGLGMTISCYNFKMYSPREEGLASEPQFIFTKNNKKHYFNFRTNLFNSESRWISINFLRDK